MPHVYIPVELRPLTRGLEVVEVPGSSVREVIDSLEASYPGVKGRLCVENRLAPGLSIVVDGSISSLGLLQPVNAEQEVHFLPSIGGG